MDFRYDCIILMKIERRIERDEPNVLTEGE